MPRFYCEYAIGGYEHLLEIEAPAREEVKLAVLVYELERSPDAVRDLRSGLLPPNVDLEDLVDAEEGWQDEQIKLVVVDLDLMELEEVECVAGANTP